MGSLTPFLQTAFADQCPKGWVCEAEVPLVDKVAAKRLGFNPRADVRLTEKSTSRRVWVEFEVSRADPVANHAKYATAALMEGLGANDSFVSMTSAHIDLGRAALAAGTTIWMRSLGISAFQVALLPGFDNLAIKTLNSRKLNLSEDLELIPVRREIDRVLAVTSAVTAESGHRIHKVDNPYSVAVNVRQWNADVLTPGGKTLWGQRRVQYFVFDPASELFAPAKFCAFIPGPNFGSGAGLGMTMEIYAQLGEQDPRFDGHVARTHLQNRLAYDLVPLRKASAKIQGRFQSWVAPSKEAVSVNADPQLLMPP